MNTHRLGKIARLPLPIRQRLNERLADNEPAEGLLRWLNGLPEVEVMLLALFDGRRISQQNLSAWQTGGYRDWERAQEIRARVRGFLDDAEELDEEIGRSRERPVEHSSLLDRVGDRMAVALLQLFREAEDGEKGPSRTREMLEIARELARLRRGDHQRQHAEIVQQRWLQEKELAARELRQEEEKELSGLVATVVATARVFREELIHGLAAGNLRPNRERLIREYFARHAERFGELGVPGLPEGQELYEEVEAVWNGLENPPPLRADLKVQSGPSAEKPEEMGAETSLYKAAQGHTRQEILVGRTGPSAPGAGGLTVGNPPTRTNEAIRPYPEPAARGLEGPERPIGGKAGRNGGRNKPIQGGTRPYKAGNFGRAHWPQCAGSGRPDGWQPAHADE